MGLGSCNSELIRANPADIRFSQESIPVCFDYPHEEDRLDKAVDLIINNRLAASDFPPMSVVLVEDRLWTLNNRRLWVFRKAGVTDVFVSVIRRSHDESQWDHFLESNLHKVLSPRQFYPWLREECHSEFTPPPLTGGSGPDRDNSGTEDNSGRAARKDNKSRRPRRNAFHVETPLYIKVEFPDWWFLRLFPDPEDESFTATERKNSIKSAGSAVTSEHAKAVKLQGSKRKIPEKNEESEGEGSCEFWSGKEDQNSQSEEETQTKNEKLHPKEGENVPEKNTVPKETKEVEQASQLSGAEEHENAPENAQATEKQVPAENEKETGTSKKKVPDHPAACAKYTRRLRKVISPYNTMKKSAKPTNLAPQKRRKQHSVEAVQQPEQGSPEAKQERAGRGRNCKMGLA
ncbi:hypothetical protein R1flu_022879 [Riccia fluitans]|uniref:Uncharacterized protein n=1 Tax=Riccia fluitans TaxID=41844 RepID=A0ABD1XQK1_9MARC